MILNGLNFPNPNWGYVTTIAMPLSFSKLGDGRLSSFDNGQAYDKYSCKCNFVFTETQMNNFYNIYNDDSLKRGQSVKLQSENGFYPFSISVNEPLGGFDVYITNVKNKGMIDNTGKFFGVECVFIWAYSSISWKSLDNNYCKLGNLTFCSYSNIRYSKFKPTQGLSVAVQNTAGGTVYGFNNPDNNEKNEVKFTLTLRDTIASNIINKIINTYRNNNIAIQGANNYFIFTLSEGDNTSFNAKLNKGNFVIKHKKHNQFDIDFSLTKV